MKRSLLVLLFTLIALSSCYKEFSGEFASNDTHYVTFKVDAAKTKTSMSYENGKYSMLWEEGDRIVVFEYADGFDSPLKYLSEPLESTDIIDGGKTAQFRVNLTSADGSAFKYIAVYPSTFSGGYEPYCEYLSWGAKGKSASEYDSWCKDWDYDGPEVDPHLLLRVVLPYEQRPTATCFDPTANTMVSKVIESDSQIQEMAELQFARIGGILRITLKGLTDYVGKQVTSANFSFGDSFGGNLNCDYDSALEKYKFYKGFNQIDLYPDKVTINEEGCADLWIRCYAGAIIDWFSLYITLADAGGKGDVKGKGEESVVLGKYVDLAALSRSIVIPEGGMGTFSVSTWGVADVQGVDNISYKVNNTMTGFTVTWTDVENASGYNFWYAPENNQENMVKVNDVVDNLNGTHSITVTGLNPDTYVLKIIPIPVEGHALIEPNYYYPVSVPVGVLTEQSIYNYFFQTDQNNENVFQYDYEGVQLGYKNIYASGGSTTLVTSQSKWSLWSINEFCNKITGMTIIADHDTATDNRYYLGRTFRPMDYVKVEASSYGTDWTTVSPNYGEPDINNNKYPVSYNFPDGTKYFRMSSNDEQLAADVAADAGLMCTFYSINLLIYK